jgi:pyruvate/2-oxoglutarate dehydrogenase complex dihydrolipoamide dehydrogenase (E3) component
MEKRMTVHTDTEAVEMRKDGSNYIVVGKDTRTGSQREIAAEKILLTAGRKSNADILKVENTGEKIHRGRHAHPSRVV